MVILNSQYDQASVPLLNRYIFTVFAPDLEHGQSLNPLKIDRAGTFLSHSLALGSSGNPIDDHDFEDLLKSCFPDLQEFIESSSLPFTRPTCGSFPMKIFAEVFDLMLELDFLQIFQTIESHEAIGLGSSRDLRLASRSGEPMPEGFVLGVPANDHFKNLLHGYINAGTNDLMVIDVGTVRFIDSMDRNDTDSVNTGPFPIVATPNEINQMHR